MASSRFNNVLSGVMVVRNRKGGTVYGAHDSQAAETSCKRLKMCAFARSALESLIKWNKLPSEGCMKCLCIFSNSGLM